MTRQVSTSIRVARDDGGVVLQIALPRERAEVAVLLADVRQVSDLADADQDLGRGQARLHRRDQTLAAGQKLGLIRVAAEDLDGLGDRPGREVGELPWIIA